MQITNLCKITLVAFLFCVTTPLLAQVKIGTNPTTIEAGSNLEVEAALEGRKFKVNKNSGRVTIVDGTQGVNKVLTSNATGDANWQLVDANIIATLPKGKMGGASTSNLAHGTPVSVAFSDVNFEQGGVIKAGNNLRLPINGTYQLSVKLDLENSSACNGSTQISTIVWLQRNAVNMALFDDRISTRSNDRFSIQLTGYYNLAAGDYMAADVSIVLVGLQTTPAGCTTRVVNGEMTAVYVP
ncbi:hypothetical protein DSL64_26675 [Dyadobacter luteus]|uniref:C1q domain-containing protein n=1 Tax=Dyadobacter luteus TaxID=2259619 RepID=A0A3D8Y6I9_9BACT|nr:hypothetical protein [Dyadobacter luteus]REA56506.1 hypothetical protein DSL64_26675 [Dyadobacter luteus]